MSKILFTFCVLLALTTVPAFAKPNPDFRVVSSISGVQWVDVQVAIAAARPLYRVLTKRTGLTISDVKPLPKKALLSRLKAGTANLAFLSPVEYLEALEKMTLIPLCRPRVVGREKSRLVLLVRKDSKFKKLQDLQGKVIGLQQNFELSQVYLRVLLSRLKLGEPRKFFRQIRRKKKQQSALLEVLLGEADAALVTDVVVEVMALLNPQIKRRLTVLHASEAHYQPPVVVTKSVPTAKVKRLRDVMTTLHEDPKGKQLMLIFRLNRLIPVGKNDYDGLKALWKEYRRITRGVARRP